MTLHMEKPKLSDLRPKITARNLGTGPRDINEGVIPSSYQKATGLLSSPLSYSVGTLSENPQYQDLIGAVERKLKKLPEEKSQDIKKVLDVYKTDIESLKKSDVDKTKIIQLLTGVLSILGIAVLIIAVLVLGPILIGIGRWFGDVLSDWLFSDHNRNIDDIFKIGFGMIIIPIYNIIRKLITKFKIKKINPRQFFGLE